MSDLQDKKSRKEHDQQLVYQLDGRPGLVTAVPLGLQHVLAMFTSNLAPILIVAAVCPVQIRLLWCNVPCLFQGSQLLSSFTR